MFCAMIRRRTYLYAAVVVLLSTPAGAGPITWTLSDVVFQDGSSVVGSFVFDADESLYSDIAISTNRASYDTGDVADFPPYASTSRFLGLIEELESGGDLTGKPLLLLFFVEALTNSGGSVPLDVTPIGIASFEVTCFAAGCSQAGSASGLARKVRAGSVTSVAEPASLLLFGVGIAAVAARRRWQRAGATAVARD